MSQVSSHSVPNGSGAAVRANMNLLFGALMSGNSGPTAPSPTVPGMPWWDEGTSPKALRVRNGGNTAWLEVLRETMAAKTMRGNASASAGPETELTAAQVMTLLGFTESIGANGYQKLPSGLIVQWITGVTASGGVTLNFPTTFPTGARNCQVSVNSAGAVFGTFQSLGVSSVFAQAWDAAGNAVNGAAVHAVVVGN